ncbi:hypothetical protein EKO27_g8114 [Xylaria grammica]|uniref:BTB domain-containing protein n=1 Tax=Xylaria grammica TaxID=363999 RepID=A0A439CXY2_9PEZI|nr:hypothetical protein EKO27_g8114 [Xylaria grammica]
MESTEPQGEASQTPTQTPPRALTPIPETEATSGSPVMDFHRDADLRVIVETPHDEPTVYMVCGSAIACASLVWRSMLYHNTAYSHDVEDETKHEQIQTIRLNGDPEAIGLLFRIIHYDFKHVPKEPTLDQLFELGKIACQYRCTHILYPWANQWISRLSDFAAEDNCYSECHKALYVAWTFGELKLYRDMVDALIVSSGINAHGKIVNIAGQPLEDMLIPRDLLDIIVETRACTIAKILDAVKTPIHALSHGKQAQRSTYCRIGKDSQACETMMLGSIIPALTKAGLFPIPEPERFTGSIEYLQNKLEMIKTVPYVGKEWMPHMSHESCNLGIGESITVCLKGMMVPLSGSIMSWMSDQAKTCGIEPTQELKDWQQKSEDASLEHATESDLVHHPKNQVKEERDSTSPESAQENSETAS